MQQSLGLMTFLVFGLYVTAVDQSASAQSRRPAKVQSIKLTAEQLVKECKTSSAKAEEKYKGKTLRVTGVVGDVYDDMLFLRPKAKGESGDVGIRYGNGNKPPVKKGEEATFEGEFDRVAVLGPALINCKLVKDDGRKK